MGGPADPQVGVPRRPAVAAAAEGTSPGRMAAPPPDTTGTEGLISMKTEYTDTASEYQAVRGAIGLVDYDGVGLVRVSGDDATGFLGSVATRPVDFLLEGQISSALVLTEGGTVLSE